MAEGEIKKADASSMMKGSYIVIDGVACKVVDTQTSKPGKHGHAKIRIQAVGIIDEKKRDIVMPGHDLVDVPMVDKRGAQVLSISGNTANVMDSETYETFDLKIPEEMKGQVSEGSQVIYWLLLKDKIMKQIKSA